MFPSLFCGLGLTVAVALFSQMVEAFPFLALKRSKFGSLNDMGTRVRTFESQKNYLKAASEIAWQQINDNRDLHVQDRKKKRRKIPLPKKCFCGSQGPQGPPGPPGPPGGNIDINDIEEYTKDFLKELLVKKNATQILTDLEDKKESYPVAFAAELAQNVFVREFGEPTMIKEMTIPFGSEMFDQGVVVEDGLFKVTRRGLYQVSATIILTVKDKEDTFSVKKPEVRVYLNVDSVEKRNRRLTWRGTMNGTATASFSGLVRLLRNQAILIVVENLTRSVVQVCKASVVSAVWTGGYKKSWPDAWD